MEVKDCSPLLSIIIVNYKVANEICQLIRSLQEAELYDACETIIVDNYSGDESQKLISGLFPGVKWIGLKANFGFGKACNVGAKSAKGKYLLFINPDSIVSRDTLRISYDFMESHPDVGIMGPKIMKSDGTFQAHCRRSYPTPFNAFSYLFGLHRLFPRNPSFNQYLLTHLSSDISMEVDALSGSFMFFRADLFARIGGFDEIFFMYGEDIDICVRCRESGYKVWYNPSTQIIHFKGRSSAQNLIRSRVAFYDAMIIFSRKYHNSYGTFFPKWLLIIGILLHSVVNIGSILARSFRATLIDVVLINIVLWATTSLRFLITGSSVPYFSNSIWLLVGMHFLMTICFIGIFVYRGIYSSERYSSKNTLVSAVTASILFMSMVFLLKDIAFSRIAFSVSAILITILLVGWRIVLPQIRKGFKKMIYVTGNVVIIGNTAITSRLLHEIEKDKTAHILGIIWPQGNGDQQVTGEYEGYPILGVLDDLTGILKKFSPDLLLIASNVSWYSTVIQTLSVLRPKNLTIRWVPHDLFDLSPELLPKTIVLNDFSV